MNTIALNAADWLGWLMDRHIPNIALAVCVVIFIVADLRRPEE